MNQNMAFTEQDFQKNVKLSKYTTIQLGGEAKYFLEATSEGQILDALEFAKNNNIKVQILGGGSNILFQDAGFDGLVLKIAIKFVNTELKNDYALVTAGAGVYWDDLVSLVVNEGLAGVEALAGIPSTVGATPIQNVGAYGQDVSETIVEVKAIDRETLETLISNNSDCKLSYRQSVFKSEYLDQYIVTEVTFKLRVNGRPVIAYPQLEERIKTSVDLDSLTDGREVLSAVRETVLQIRAEKSMVLNPEDRNSISSGSFFTNPIVSEMTFNNVQAKAKQLGIQGPVPNFGTGDEIKIPAAWLLEKAGFVKGYKKGAPAHLSLRHNLAIVNNGGTTKDVLELQKEIQLGVKEKFGVELEREPILVN